MKYGRTIAASDIENVQDALAQAADQTRVAVSRIGDQAKDSYGMALERARTVAETVDPFVQKSPYAALAMAAGIGLVVGLLMAGRGPKVIYVKGGKA